MHEESEAAHASTNFRRQICCRAEAIAALPDALADWAQQLGIAPRTVSYVSLMLDELVSNIARHAYAGREDGVIEMVARYDGKVLCVHLRDYGPPFDPLKRLPPETGLGIDERDFGGLGVHFVTEMADCLFYRRDGDANEIIFCRFDEYSGASAVRESE